MIFETAGKKTDAIGEQCRCQRIAWMAGIVMSVEAEVDGARTVEDSARIKPRNLAQR
jgi:hypothetical protein